MSYEDEIWKVCVGYENYSVSNYGRVRNDKSKKFKKFGGGKIYDASRIRCNLYYCVTLYNNGKSKTFTVHRLVCVNFIPNPYNYTQVNHKDGNKLNNHVDNLEWCTPSLNLIHAYATKLRRAPFLNKFGSEHNTAKKVAQMDNENNIINIFGSIIEANKSMGLSKKSHISCVCKGKRKSCAGYKWKYLESKNEF